MRPQWPRNPDRSRCRTSHGRAQCSPGPATPVVVVRDIAGPVRPSTPDNNHLAVNVASRIHVGIGGWTFDEWRGSFYPDGLKHDDELAYASRRLTSIEINGTYYRTQTPASFAKWRDATPEGFVFSVKASRFATNRRILGEAGESIERFVNSGLAELGPKLGPLVWQLAPTKVFDEADVDRFFTLLPRRVAGVALRHVLEVRHPSFAVPAYLALARRHDVATVLADTDDHPSFADPTGPFVYARLMRTDPQQETGYPEGAIAGWADCARRWTVGEDPAELPHVGAVAETVSAGRDVFIYFISGAKEKAPFAAMATIEQLARD